MTTQPSRKQSWPIRMRLRMLITGSWKWNAWVRDFAAQLEKWFVQA